MGASSLGVLTLDLVAKIGGFLGPINRAEEGATTAFGKMRDGINKYGAAAAAGALAVGAALGAMTAETVNNANEIARLSAIAGTSTDQFQRMAAGAKAFGFEQDALADILKDSQEKIGEFSTIGGGGALDFFEQIAPKIGVTKKAFEGLSGADGLILYAQSLEKAGVSSDEMIFYMESLASESSKLLPLLKNGGENLKLFGDAAASAGAIMDKKTIAKANELKGAIYLLDLQIDGAKNSISSELIPALVDLANAFSKTESEAANSTTWAEDFANGLRGIGVVALGTVGAVATLYDFLNILPKTFEGAFDFEMPWEKAKRFIQQFQGAAAETEKTAIDYAGRMNDLALGGKFANGATGKTQKIGAALNQAEEERMKTVAAGDGAKVAADKKAALDAFLQLNASELQAVKNKYAAMRDQINANASFSAADKSRALAEVNTAQAKELAAIGQKLKDEAKAKAEAASAAMQQKKQELAAFALMNASELDQMKAKFQAEREQVKAHADWSAAEKNSAIAQINIAEGRALAEYSENRAKELAVFADMNATELQMTAKKYAAMRDEVKKNTKWSIEEKNQAMAEIKRAEEKENRDAVNGLRTKYDALLAIELAYQAELKTIEDSNLSPEQKQQYAGIAEMNYNGAVDQQQAPFNKIEDRLNGKEETKFDLLQEQYALEKEIILKNTIDNEIARQELLTSLQDEYHKNQLLTTMSYGSDIAGGMADILKGMGDDSSAAYKTMFALSKSFAIADALMKIQQGVASAFALPFPANLEAVASTIAATGSLVSNIQSIRMVGQAHDGVMSVPQSGSWNLERGERVLPQDTAARLDSTLAAIGNGGMGGTMAGGVSVKIENYGTAKAFDVQQIDAQTVRIIARDEIQRDAGRAPAGALASPNSDLSKAMQRNLMVERRR